MNLEIDLVDEGGFSAPDESPREPPVPPGRGRWSRRWRTRPRRLPATGRLDALPAVLLFLLGPAAYHRMLTPGWAIADYDILTYFAPYRSYLAAGWRQGRWVPLWNPDIYLGAPFLANIQAAAVYPPNLLLAVLNSRLVRNQLVVHARGSASFDIRDKVLAEVWIPRDLIDDSKAAERLNRHCYRDDWP